MVEALGRCGWAGDDPLMIAYHDTEWGVPVFDDRKQFEFLILESAQAGLSWRTVLHRRVGYRRAFADFDPQKVARFDAKRIESLLQDTGIIRNRLKVSAAVNNAQRFLEVQKEFGTFCRYIWPFVGNKTKVNCCKTLKDLPPKAEESDALSKDLIKRGFKFVGRDRKSVV